MKSLIYGYGETGKSFERYLNKNNKKFEIFDNNLSNFKKEFNLQDFEKIFCSPGIPKDIYKKLVTERNFPDRFFTDLLCELNGVGYTTARLLWDAGYLTKEQVLNAPDEELLQIKGIGKKLVEKIKS